MGPQFAPCALHVVGVHGQLVKVFFVHWPRWHESLQFLPIPLLHTQLHPAAPLHGEPPGVPLSMQLLFWGQSASVEQGPPDGREMSVDDVQAPLGPGGLSAQASSHAVPSCTMPWKECRAKTQKPSEQRAGWSRPMLMGDHVSWPSTTVVCPLGGVVPDAPAIVH
jgi:hypothetical protein